MGAQQTSSSVTWSDSELIIATSELASQIGRESTPKHPTNSEAQRGRDASRRGAMGQQWRDDRVSVRQNPLTAHRLQSHASPVRSPVSNRMETRGETNQWPGAMFSAGSHTVVPTGRFAAITVEVIAAANNWTLECSGRCRPQDQLFQSPSLVRHGSAGQR